METLPSLTESIWARGWRDTTQGLHSFKFWALEVLGGAVMGYFDPVFAIIWVIGIFAALWIGATGAAPFKQRIEARAALRFLTSPPPDPWLSAEDATQMVYDGMTSETMTGELLLRMFRRSNAQGMTMWQQVGVFLAKGINDGVIVAEGTRGGRSQKERIPPGMQRLGTSFEFLDGSGINWTLDRADKQSIQNFLRKEENDQSSESTEATEAE